MCNRLVWWTETNNFMCLDKWMSDFASAVIFFGDPHFVTIDGGNYTFNGFGEYTMVNYDNGTFLVQARTGFLPNATDATAFLAGAVKEVNSSTVEVRTKIGGMNDVHISPMNRQRTSFEKPIP